MKKLILLSFIITLLISCESSNTPDINNYEHLNNNVWFTMEYKIEQKTIDSCEYIIIFGVEGRNIIHKANCKNHK